jgi:hypothetical protein
MRFTCTCNQRTVHSVRGVATLRHRGHWVTCRPDNHHECHSVELHITLGPTVGPALLPTNIVDINRVASARESDPEPYHSGITFHHVLDLSHSSRAGCSQPCTDSLWVFAARRRSSGPSGRAGKCAFSPSTPDHRWQLVCARHASRKDGSCKTLYLHDLPACG